MDRQTIKNVWAAYLEVTEAAKMDKVDPKALKKDFKDREDKDIDNDGDVDSSDEYLHNRRKTIAKAIKKEEVELDEKAVSQAQQMAAGAALAAKRGEIPVSDLEGASKKMYDNLSTKELEKFASTKHEGLPKKVEEAVDHTKGATPPEKMDDKYSQGAKDFVAQHEVEVAVDGQKAADDTADNIKKSEPTMKRRSGDNASADAMGTVDDVTKKAGFKEAKTFADLMKSLMED